MIGSARPPDADNAKSRAPAVTDVRKADGMLHSCPRWEGQPYTHWPWHRSDPCRPEALWIRAAHEMAASLDRQPGVAKAGSAIQIDTATQVDARDEQVQD